MLYNEFMIHGKVPEEIYDRIGLEEDTNSKGIVRQRRSNKDALQRAMCLSAPALKNSRLKY